MNVSKIQNFSVNRSFNPLSIKDSSVSRKSQVIQNNDFAAYNKSLLNLSFTAYYSRKLIYKLPPIIEKAEYDEVLQRLYNAKTVHGQKFWPFEQNKHFYKDIKDEYKGLLPYCGNDDVSYYINGYLGGRLDKCGVYIPTEQTACDFIRALDYSLKQLDKDVGTFSGYVFRKGYFRPNSGQYASASKSPLIAASFQKFNPEAQYSIIKVKDAHKICDFQKMMRSSYAEEESEILTDRKMKSRFISPEEYSEDVLDAKKKFARFLSLESALPDVCCGKQTKIWTLGQAMKKIRVYEQI